MSGGVRGTAFASDFDGTLCQSDWETGTQQFDPAILDAVRRYQDAGGLFGICTGRPLFSVESAVEGILVPDFYIVTTGAQVAGSDGTTLFEKPIDRAVAQDLYERYAQDDMGFLAITNGTFYSVGRAFAPQMSTVPSLDAVGEGLLGVSLEYHGREDVARRVCRELNDLYGDVVEGFQNLGSIDVVARGCSKGAGVSVVREAFGLSCVVGIGDSYNDISLLRGADVSYTFHASPQVVRDAAMHVVEDLAEAIDHFVGRSAFERR